MATPEQLANRETWRAALLSGDYQQTRGNLRQQALDDHDVYGYCCLGVALDVLGGGSWQTDVVSRYIDSNNRENLGDMRSETFEALFGFDPVEFPTRIAGDVQGVFISANDTKHYTFEQIAALIPAQDKPKGYTVDDSPEAVARINERYGP
jgi:hypothetical protein